MSAEQIAADPETDDIKETEGTERPRLFLVPVPGPLAARLADLRPYLPTRSQLAVPFRGVGAGAGVLAGRGWTWISEDGWIWEGWTKVGGFGVRSTNWTSDRSMKRRNEQLGEGLARCCRLLS